MNNFSVPSVLSFSDDTAKFEKNVKVYDCTTAYAPTQEVQNELRRISGRLDDCLYDDYRRDIDALKPNVEIDKELAALMAAEDDIKQSRRNLRRRAQKICPATGPTGEEERELKELNKNSILKMYELEDFERDFNTKPFVATEMVDMSLERIEDNIRKRQLALQNLRRYIYETSVLRVTGYYVKENVSKNNSKQTNANIDLQQYKHAFGTALENSKDAFETAVGYSKQISKAATESSKQTSKVATEKSEQTFKVPNKSHSEGDDSYTKVKEIYRAERRRFKNNLTMFNARLNELMDYHKNRKVSVQNKTRYTDDKRDRSDRSTVKPDVKTAKRDVRTAKRDVRTAKRDVNNAKTEDKKAKTNVETGKVIGKKANKKRPKDSDKSSRRR